MGLVSNPVLPGFHPDPCIVRADDDYFIATSTFEWWPGVQIHRSRDLANWELAGYALTRKSQLDLRGVPDSGGVWAPALSYRDDTFWLLYSDVKSFAGPFKDVTNYLVTAPNVAGPWSEPVELNRSGFDPSLFHDDDGRTWLLNQHWKPSAGPDAFDGIVIQEYSARERRLLDEPRLIFAGSSLGSTEGPHLYRKDGFYYLVTAEGGTGWSHAVTVARSRSLFGPYELSPYHPLLTAATDPDNPLQKAGHGSLVQDAGRNWYLAHLCSRPLNGTRRCTLGRETALQNIDWPAGGWPQLSAGEARPQVHVRTGAAQTRPYFTRFADGFDGAELSHHWNTLREPASADWLSLRERPGHLRMRGRHSLQSLLDVSLVGCRVAHHRCVIETVLDYQPYNPRQRAGLCLYYNTANFCLLYLSADDDGRFANVLCADNRRLHESREHRVPLIGPGAVRLRFVLRDTELTLHCRPEAASAGWRQVGPVMDASKLSDDYPMDSGLGWYFTGLFVALHAHDANGLVVPADFDSFHYEAHE